MLKKSTIVLAMLMMGGLSTAYGQRAIRYGNADVSHIHPSMLSADRPSFDMIEMGEGLVPQNAEETALPPYMLPRAEYVPSNDALAVPEYDPFFGYTAKIDTYFDIYPDGVQDTSFILTNPDVLDPETGEAERLFLVPFGDLPTEFTDDAGDGWRAFGACQVMPAWNSSDPEATVRIDSIMPLMIVPGGVFGSERPPISVNWFMFPFLITPENRSLFSTEQGTQARLLDRIFDDVGVEGQIPPARLQFMDVNDGRGYYEIPAQDINTAIEVNAAGDIIAINRLKIETPELEFPAKYPIVFVFVPENYDDLDAGSNTEERVRIIGGWEWFFGNNANWALGGLYRRDLENNQPMEGTDIIIDMFNMGFRWNAAPAIPAFPHMRRQPLRFNLDIAIFGEYMGDDNVDTWPWEGTTGVREDESGRVNGLALGQVYPNPVYGTANIPFGLDRPMDVTLQVTNILGEVVFEEHRPMMDAGSYVWDVQTANFTEGTYIYTMSAGGNKFSGKMTVLR